MPEGKIAYETRHGVKFDAPLIPFGAKVSFKPISSKDEARLHQFHKNTSRNLHGMCVVCGARMVRRFAHLGLRKPRKTCQHPIIMADIFRTKKSHQEKAREKTESTNMSGDVCFAVTKYIEKSCTFQTKLPSPFHSNTSIHEANENKHRQRLRTHAERLLGQRERSLALRGMDWNNSFPNLEDQAPERYIWRNGRPTRVRETRLQEARRKRGIFDVSSEDTEHHKAISQARTKIENCVDASKPCVPKQE